LYQAFLASRCILSLVDGEDVERFLDSEDVELDAARNGRVIPDLLPPRRVSTTLLLKLHHSETRDLAFHFIDALAVVASTFDDTPPVTHEIRVTVLVNNDAAAYAKRHNIIESYLESSATIATRLTTTLAIKTSPLPLVTYTHTMISSIQGILLDHTQDICLAAHTLRAGSMCPSTLGRPPSRMRLPLSPACARDLPPSPDRMQSLQIASSSRRLGGCEWCRVTKR
jgi:hypothetical protein